MKRFFQIAMCAVLSAFILVAFQNCHAPLQFISTGSINQNNLISNLTSPLGSGSPTSSGDHGQGYGGKLSVTFYVAATDVKFSASPYLTNAVSFSISPALPSGLSLNSSSGEITGSPVATTNEYSNYSIAGVSGSGVTSVINVAIAVGATYIIDPTIDGDGLSDANLGDGICADINGRCSIKAAQEQAASNPVNTRIVMADNSIVEIVAKGIAKDLNIPNTVGPLVAPAGTKLLSSLTCSRSRNGFAVSADLSINSKVHVEVRKYSDQSFQVGCGFSTLSATSKAAGSTCDLPISTDGVSNATQQGPCAFTVPENMVTLTCNHQVLCSTHSNCGAPAASQILASMTGFNLHLTVNMDYTVFSAVNYVNDGVSVVLDGGGPWECF